ncbi:MAG: PPC domain-containing DNA-binding protein [Leptolyngbyaceae cyanobacterium]
MNALALRLSPGEDLKQALLNYCRGHSVDAACILSGIGSLRRGMIRFANQPEGTLLEEKLEIISLAGTVSQQGAHLHIAVSDQQGQVIGGHLMEGSLIYTTAEIMIGVIPYLIFKREFDPITGCQELHISTHQ